MRLLTPSVLCLLAVVFACGAQDTRGAQITGMPQKTITAVLKERTPSLMALPGVVGTAEGRCDGKPCIKVYVKEKTPDLLKRIPTEIEGYPVTIEETGEIRPLSSR